MTGAMVFPNMLCVGAAKSATTSLHHYLKGHPDVLLPATRKEGSFFSELTREGLPENYHYDVPVSLEQYKGFFSRHNGEKIIGDISPDYLYHYEKSIPNILKYCGDGVKVMCILRNPAKRAYSHYAQNVRLGCETATFEVALGAEAQRIRDKWNWLFHYRSVGLYADGVSAYKASFPHFKVFIFEEVIQDTESFMKDVYEFLDIRHHPFDQRVFNPNVVPKYPAMASLYKRFDRFRAWCHTRPALKKADRVLRGDIVLHGLRRLNVQKPFNPKVNPDTEKKLLASCAEDIARLEKIIGRDLGFWSVGGAQ